MIFKNVESNNSPDVVVLERVPDKTIVRLADNIHQEEKDDQVIFVYDEACFDLPEGREETISSIEADFDAWWTYASEEHDPPTLEERLAAIEDVIAELI